MTQEDKELLLKDLCARLPYGVMVQCITESARMANASPLTETLNTVLYRYVEENNIELKPYLRPMSSMTEEEYDDMFHQLYLGQEEFFRNCSNADTIGKIIGKDMVIYDFLTKKMFDFRCLIPKGLALVAPEGMYN